MNLYTVRAEKHGRVVYVAHRRASCKQEAIAHAKLYAIAGQVYAAKWTAELRDESHRHVQRNTHQEDVWD